MGQRILAKRMPSTKVRSGPGEVKKMKKMARVKQPKETVGHDDTGDVDKVTGTRHTEFHLGYSRILSIWLHLLGGE